jgi:peptide/nickel transport system substrate-binding protein
MVAAINGDPAAVITRIGNPTGSGVPGANVVNGMVHGGLSTETNEGRAIPQAAEAVPSIEAGTWRTLPDGRMETTWRIRENARWHDGRPLTVDDILFSWQVAQDKDLVVFSNYIGLNSVDAIEAVDPRTIVVKWNTTFIDADILFTPQSLFLLPKHLLEPAYLQDKMGIEQLPFWTTDFVGLGPYKVREWSPGSHMRLEAHDGFSLGRPKIDEIEIKFIPDSNTLVTNILANAVELTLGRNISIEQGLAVRNQWQQGRVDVAVVGFNALDPQFINPNPALLSELPFRRALLHATDRQEMADVLLAGTAPVAHTFLGREEPAYRVVESRVVAYDYDPRRAAQLIESMGIAKGPDGFYRDAAGQRFTIEVRAAGGDAQAEKMVTSVADHWQRLGIGAEPFVVPPQRNSDREFRATFPGVQHSLLANNLIYLRRIHGRETPTAENRFVGNNRARYRNPEFDALIDRVFTTIPLDQRYDAIAATVHHMTENVASLPMVYQAAPVAVGRRVQNTTLPKSGNLTTHSWNAHEWDVSS